MNEIIKRFLKSNEIPEKFAISKEQHTNFGQRELRKRLNLRHFTKRQKNLLNETNMQSLNKLKCNVSTYEKM